MEVLVFGGTSEGRRLVEWLDGRGTCDIVASTATDYGASLIDGSPRVEVLSGPLSTEAKGRLMEAHDFCCIVDATHPYALHISDSIDELARTYGKDVVRIVREDCPGAAWLSVTSATEAARYLAGTTGNILLTTGSKDLDAFTATIPTYEQRLYVRILPVAASLARTAELGIPASRVIAMQGPFSERLNAALIEELDIAYLVTKRSGTAGGVEEKVRAAQACGIELVVIERPREKRGVSFDEAKALLEERYGI